MTKSVEIFPVVHVFDEQEAIDQADLALSCGADGVYLIDHSIEVPDQLLATYEKVAKRNPDAFVGVNLLQIPAAAMALRFLAQALENGGISRLPDGLWVDNAKIGLKQTAEVREADSSLAKIRLLGGTAFKYTSSYTGNPRKAAREAVKMAPNVDVVTTSGPGTGSAPSVEKIVAMKRAIGDIPLAIASGIDSENLESYRGFVDQLLVSTSIETEPYSGIFDAARLASLIRQAHAVD